MQEKNPLKKSRVAIAALNKAHILCEQQWLRHHLVSTAACFVCYGLAMSPVYAAPDATWSGPGNNWNNDLNWTPNGVPTNTATFDTAAPTTVVSDSNTVINNLVFVPTAQQYTFDNSSDFTLNGIGFDNRSLFQQRFNNTGTLFFNNSASAALNSSVLFTNNASGSTNFEDTSTAGNATITNNGFGATYFKDSSTAGNASITNNADGSAIFFGSATAGAATIINNAGGGTTFDETSTAGSTTIANNAGGATGFGDTATAGNATITNNTDGDTSFNGSSTAGNANIANAGGVTEFFNNSTADNASITNNSLGSTQFNDSSKAGNANITNGSFGATDFRNTSTADAANIINNESGATRFFDTSTAGNASITNVDGLTIFFNNSTAGAANIVNNVGGITRFNDTSTAGAATIVNNANGSTLFVGASTGGTASIENREGAIVDLSGKTNALTIGEVFGAGDIFLGGNNLTTGNANNREISGKIYDGGINGGFGGSLTKVGSGRLTLSNDNGFTGLTTVAAGELALNGSVSGDVQINADGRLSGDGTVVGDVLNNGVIAPGSDISPLTNLSILGDYTDSATSVFETRVSSAPVMPGNLGAASGLTIFGDANLGQGTVRVLDDGGVYGMQTQYRILTNNGLQTGTFKAIVDESDLPDYLDARLIHSPQLVDLVLERNATDFADNISGLTPNQRATATSLDSGVGLIDDSLFPSYDALLFAPSDAARRQSLNIISGDVLTAYPFVANQAANRFNERIRNQVSNRAIRDAAASFAKVQRKPLQTVALDSNATAPTITSSTRSSAQLSPSFADNTPRSSVWAVVGSTRDNADSDGNGPAVGSRNRDYQLGFEKRSSNSTTFGLSLGKSDSDIDVASRSGSGDIDTTSFGTYVRQQRENNVYLSGQVSYSRHKIESTRQLLIDGVATANYDAKTLLAWGEVGKNYDKGSYIVEPNVSLRLANTRVDGFTESGGPGALSVSASGYNSRRLGIGVRVMTADRTAKFRPHLSLGFEREFGDSKAEVTNNVTGVSSFNVAGSDLGKNIFRASVGAEAELGDRLSIVGEVGIARRENQDSRSVYGGLKYGF